jgi:probable O-glycosylation ligase (exosortase A-associated)
MGLRDLIVLLFTLACIGMALRKAWYGVLALAIFSYMNPHAYAWGPVRSLPLYQILFLVVAFKTLMEQHRQPIPKDWRVYAFFVLWAYFFLTTTQALVPSAAWQKFWFVTKIYLPFIFTLLLIDTREKLYYLIITIAGSIGLLAVKGGIFAITHGFSARIYGPPATQFEENNAFAVAVLINIPLIILWYRETTHPLLKKALIVAVPLHFVCALSSWSRGALLAMTALSLVLIWHSKRKYLVLPLFLVGAYFALQALPEEWFQRMSTIETYEQDASAQGRLRAWKDGINYALRHPLLGSGFEGWLWVTHRDWHSSYVEMLSEHGFIAFGLWISMIVGTLISLTRLPKQVKGIPQLKWVENFSYMLRASLIAYMVGTAFLGLSYWDILYHLIFIAVLTKKFALEELWQYQRQPQVSTPSSASMETGVVPGIVRPAP